MLKQSRLTKKVAGVLPNTDFGVFARTHHISTADQSSKFTMTSDLLYLCCLLVAILTRVTSSLGDRMLGFLESESEDKESMESIESVVSRFPFLQQSNNTGNYSVSQRQQSQNVRKTHKKSYICTFWCRTYPLCRGPKTDISFRHIHESFNK